MILISSVIGTPSVIVDIDIVVLKLISKIEIAHLHRCQCIFDPGEIRLRVIIKSTFAVDNTQQVD